MRICTILQSHPAEGQKFTYFIFLIEMCSFVHQHPHDRTMTINSRQHDRCVPILHSSIMHTCAKKEEVNNSMPIIVCEYAPYSSHIQQEGKNSLTLSFSLRCAPLFISICTISPWPLIAANMIAVCPFCIHPRQHHHMTSLRWLLQ